MSTKSFLDISTPASLSRTLLLLLSCRPIRRCALSRPRASKTPVQQVRPQCTKPSKQSAPAPDVSKNAVANPYAHMRKDLGFEYCRSEGEKNPFVAGPLKRSDCSLVSDGAAALVITDAETAKTMRKSVSFKATAHAQDFLPMSKRNIIDFEGCSVAWARALRDADVKLSDLSFVETHDCFTIAELIEYEAMGLTPKGQGTRAIKEGWTQRDGKLPVNLSGGLKAKGHPIGTTGVSMHVISAMQLTGQAPEGMQLKNPRLAGIFNMGVAAVRQLCLNS